MRKCSGKKCLHRIESCGILEKRRVLHEENAYEADRVAAERGDAVIRLYRVGDSLRLDAAAFDPDIYDLL